MKLGIIGIGNIAHRVAKGILCSPKANLYAVASRNKDNAKEFKEQYPYDPCYLLPLIYHNIDRCIAFKKYTFDAKSYVSNGFLSFVINSLSLEDESMRKIAYSILQKTIHIMKNVTFLEFYQRNFIYSFLFLLRNSIQTPNQSLSASITIIYLLSTTFI